MELNEEKEKLSNQLQFMHDNYNKTFNFLHNLIHDNNSIESSFDKEDYIQAKNKFFSMNSKIIKRFNSIYSGNNSLSTAICSIDNDNINIQHFVQCNINEFDEDDLTLFFISVLNKLSACETSIFVSITQHNGNKIISFKTNTNDTYKDIIKENQKFIKKYNLKTHFSEKSISFLHLNAK